MALAIQRTQICANHLQSNAGNCRFPKLTSFTPQVLRVPKAKCKSFRRQYHSEMKMTRQTRAAMFTHLALGKGVIGKNLHTRSQHVAT